MKVQRILELYEMIRVLHVVALPMNFNLVGAVCQELGVLKILFFQIFITFWAFSLTFGVGQIFICAKYDWLGQIFLFISVLMLLCIYISWKSFKSGNNMQYRIQTFIGHTVFLKLRIGQFSDTQKPPIVVAECPKIFDV